MEYCARCLYPVNAKPTIILDEEGVCSGCRYHESRENLEINWEERQEILKQITDEAKKTAKERGTSHDCIVPVSGGKDSHFQVWVLKNMFGMNPLLVTFNHSYNTPAGTWNLQNLVEKSGCDMVRYTAGPESVRKISKYMLETVGDLTWHYHAGIRTYPFQVAVKYNIPHVFLGEHGFAELTGLVSLDDFVEHTKWSRKEHDMRGFDAADLVGHNGITHHDIEPYLYPSDEDIENVGVIGHYFSNFYSWEAKSQAIKMIEEWGFSPVTYPRERTFFQYAKIEDHANDVHDYLKYLKFGYGRATDDASMEIRHGRMTREEGMVMVKKYDSVEPSTLDLYCDFLGITKREFYRIIESMRDLSIWEKTIDGKWQAKDSVWKHDISNREKLVCVAQSDDRIFSEQNKNLYYNPDNPPEKTGIPDLDEFPNKFNVL